MNKILLIILLNSFGFIAFAQTASKPGVTLKETQTWLKEKIQSNGVGKWPANSYKVEFPDSCKMVINGIGVANDIVTTQTIDFGLIDFEKVTKKINSVGTLTVGLNSNELKFAPENGEEFYTRLVKALKNAKVLCGGVADDKF